MKCSETTNLCWKISAHSNRSAHRGWPRAGLLIFLLSTSSLVAGCKPGLNKAHAWGTVKVAGDSVPKGLIVFTPVKGTSGSSTGASIVDGLYDIARERGPLIGGTYRIEITALRKTDKQIPNPFEPGKMMVFEDNYIPSNYNRDSQLEVSISGDPALNKFDFALFDR